MMNITYLGHSGFLTEIDDAYFLFDYYKGAIPQMDTSKKMFVFVSHAHYDHYNRSIYEFRKDFEEIYYILSSDITAEEEGVHSVKPNEELACGGCHVRTLRSNDEGVAFLVRYHGRTLYHAGDLNWWHWEGEPEAYNTGMRRSYQAEINKLQKEKIDASFVPVDPRLGEQYCWGIDCFMKRTETSHVFPMHFWGNYEIFDRLMMEQCTQEYRDRIMKIEQEGQSFLLNGADN